MVSFGNQNLEMHVHVLLRELKYATDSLIKHVYMQDLYTFWQVFVIWLSSSGKLNTVCFFHELHNISFAENFAFCSYRKI